MIGFFFLIYFLFFYYQPHHHYLAFHHTILAGPSCKVCSRTASLHICCCSMWFIFMEKQKYHLLLKDEIIGWGAGQSLCINNIHTFEKEPEILFLFD